MRSLASRESLESDAVARAEPPPRRHRAWPWLAAGGLLLSALIARGFIQPSASEGGRRSGARAPRIPVRPRPSGGRTGSRDVPSRMAPRMCPASCQGVPFGRAA